MKKITLVVVSLLMSLLNMAQDKIYTSIEEKPILGEIVEINTTEVKYKPDDKPYPIVSVEKQDVIKVVYKNGETLIINNPTTDLRLYRKQHLWNLKMNLFSPMFGHTQLFLVHCKKPGRSVEYELNLIGLGKDQKMFISDIGFTGEDRYYGASGVGVGVGLKVIRMPDYSSGNNRLMHVMQGAYIKPGVSFNVYNRNFIASSNAMERKLVYAIVPNINIGRQWVLDNIFSIEIYGLVGYSIDNVRSTQQKVINDTGFPTIFNNNVPFTGFGYTRFSSGDAGLCAGAGVRIGYLFDMPKKKN